MTKGKDKGVEVKAEKKVLVGKVNPAFQTFLDAILPGLERLAALFGAWKGELVWERGCRVGGVDGLRRVRADTPSGVLYLISMGEKTRVG